MTKNLGHMDIEKKTEYDSILEEFGISRIKKELLRIGADHLLFRRGIVFAHRDFDKILNLIEQKKGWAIISGRGPSNDLTYGHLILFELIKYLQGKYQCQFFLPFSDDEKYVFRKVDSLKSAYNLALKNAIDIFSLGFQPDQVHAYISSSTPRIAYLALTFSVNLTYNSIKSALGLIGEENVGTPYYSCIQAAHILHPTTDYDLPVVVPIGLDQDVFMRLTRDVARKRKITLPASLYIKYLKGLDGGPMSSSNPENCIFLRDSSQIVKKKIVRAFTGGRATIKEQRELGANPKICTIYDLFEKLFIKDDKELADICRRCKNGEIICGLDCKPKLINLIHEFQKQFEQRKKGVIKNLHKYFDHEINLSEINAKSDSK